jgi:hypothetical protein
MKEINERLNDISELIDRVDAKVFEINNKLDAVIKALHEYDGNDEYGESSFEAFMDDEEVANKRMDIIGQNGNEGSHYVTNEEADEDANKIRVGKDKDSTQDKHVVGDKDKHVGETKKRNKRKYYKPKQTK